MKVYCTWQRKKKRLGMGSEAESNGLILWKVQSSFCPIFLTNSSTFLDYDYLVLKVHFINDSTGKHR